MDAFFRDRNGHRWYPYDADGGTFLHPEGAENDMADMDFEDLRQTLGPLDAHWDD